MRVEAEADVRALRRIALLVNRAKEDWGPGCGELDEIAEVIERMKRNAALGTPLSGDDLHAMVLLVGELTGDAHPGKLHNAVLTELCDLAEQLTP